MEVLAMTTAAAALSPLEADKSLGSLHRAKQETYLIEECVSKNYTQKSCEKVFCQPWQKCVQGSCLCKLPYQCPKNGTIVCTSNGKTFRTYCHLKSYECQHKRSKFLHRGNCNIQDNFQIFLGPENATSEGTIQVEVNSSQKMFICGNGWSMNEANVACRHIGFPEGADLLDLVDPDGASHPLECLKATCRGIETSLAECTFTKQDWNNQKLAKVVCHTQLKAIPFYKLDDIFPVACRGETFHCMSDVCIPNKYLCNNEMDCLTGEDESHQLCKPIHFNYMWLDSEQTSCIHSVLTEWRKTEENDPCLLFVQDEFPWQVAISDEERITCGGTYIGDCWILTAASCVRPAHPELYRVFTGLRDMLRINEGIDIFKLKRVIVHEKFNSQTYENNIALLEMKPEYMGKCSPYSSVPACIPWSQYMFKDGQQCKVSGYGRDENLIKQFQLKWGSVYLIGNCSEIYKEHFHNGMECAGTADGSVDTCAKDAGGPLVCFDSNNVGYVWGIASSEHCGKKGQPGIYTKVANYFDWISYHTGRSLISRYNV
ncbi:hypothetical protein JD844_026565 [Phrynosoma platyrhinos]|uniref:Complement factor I n=1 Tax=Phrynosoma platyrhinos TaxID=52577 RepID=A0ABQ7SF05_PHRPL|nr:hypothetical protein JD844_026565 [Phrynosoma platyrhinos]